MDFRFKELVDRGEYLGVFEQVRRAKAKLESVDDVSNLILFFRTGHYAVAKVILIRKLENATCNELIDELIERGHQDFLLACLKDKELNRDHRCVEFMESIHSIKETRLARPQEILAIREVDHEWFKLLALEELQQQSDYRLLCALRLDSLWAEWNFEEDIPDVYLNYHDTLVDAILWFQSNEFVRETRQLLVRALKLYPESSCLYKQYRQTVPFAGRLGAFLKHMKYSVNVQERLIAEPLRISDVFHWRSQ